MLLAGAALLGYAWRSNSKGLSAASVGLLLRGVTGYCPAYGAMGINNSDTKRALSGERGVHIRESITINAPAENIYRFWRQLERLPEVMPHLAKLSSSTPSVRVGPPRRSTPCRCAGKRRSSTSCRSN